MNNRILVIDDEKLVRNFWEAIFIKTGYNGRCVPNAEKALELLEIEEFQVFFIDISLPGLDGIEFLNRVKSEYPSAIFYAMTGFSSLFDVDKCRLAGFDDYFQKPYEIDLLIDVIRQACKRIDRWKRYKSSDLL